jgi:prepilin-type N-terminal cleavage/methylation domain-containing protein
MPRRSRRGFTLIEVMVALAVGAVVVLGARLALAQLADDADRIVKGAARLDGEANGERLLRSLFRRLEVGTEIAGPFGGDERAMHFTTWCDLPAGWQERCQATVAIDTVDDAPALVAHLSTGEVITLRAGFHRATLRYLNDPASGGSWFRGWGTGLTAPRAVGIIVDDDTLVLRIGDRG